jgi:hypothetical protein
MDWRTFMIRWNNEHPLDKQFREKHNIAFNSIQHRQINQFDLYLQYVEDQLFEEAMNNSIDNKNKAQLFKKGEWLQEQVITKQENDDLFDKIDLSNMNSSVEFEE